MTNVLRRFFYTAAVCFACASVLGGGAQTYLPYVPGELIVKYADVVSDSVPTNIYRLLFARKQVDVELLASQYAQDPAVEWAHPNYRYGELLSCSITLPSCTLPDDPYITSCGSHGSVDLPDLWGTHDSKVC